MVWFRLAASHYPSQFDRFMSPHCAIMCWVTVMISMTIPASPTHLWWETTGDRWFPQNSETWSFCVCFVDSLNNLSVKQSSCPWLKTPWRQCHFTVLTTCHFYNEFILQNIFKMLIACSASYIGYHEFKFYYSKMGNHSWSLCLVPCLLITKVLKVPGHQ